MNIENEIIKLYPEAQRVLVSGNELLYYQIETPAHTFDVFCIVKKGKLIQIKTRDGYNEILLKELLEYIKQKDVENLPDRELTVWNGLNSEISPFTRIGVTPPDVACIFKNESEKLSQITYWVFPLLDGEFNGGESKSEFNFINGNRGENIHVIDWFRGGKVKIEANKAFKPTPKSGAV